MKQRVLTAALLIPPVLLAVFLYNPLPFWGLGAAALIVGHAELCRLAGEKPKVPYLGLVLLAGTVLASAYSTTKPWGAANHLALTLIASAIILLASVGVAAACGLARGRRGSSVRLLASLWLGAPIAAMSLLKYPFGDIVPTFDWSTPLLLVFVPLWIGDSLAIFAGKAFGKHLLAPKISPKKTVEGAVANLIGCLGGAVGIGTLIGAPIAISIGSGIACGILGQLGDLLESAMKRSAGVKDSGTLLPGHGGLLDRIDSILLSAPAVALVVIVFERL